MIGVGVHGVTLVVHGKVAPPAAVVSALATQVGAIAADVEVCTSWVADASTVNPLAALDAVMRAAAHPLLVVVAIDPSGRHVPIGDVLDALVARGGLVIAQQDGDACAALRAAHRRSLP